MPSLAILDIPQRSSIPLAASTMSALAADGTVAATPFCMKTAGELCTRNVVTIGKDEPVREAARRMRDRHIGSLVVVEHKEGRARPIGILTDRDLVVSVLADDWLDADRARVTEAMSKEPVTVGADESLFETFRLMRTYGIRRIPVVDQEGYLAGLLSFDDVLEQLADALSDMTELIARGRQIEEAQLG